MIKPTPTTCIAISFGTPNKLHANGISNSDPPATPDAPDAETAANNSKHKCSHKINFNTKRIYCCKRSTAIVTAAPAILIVAPRGIDTA